MFWKKFFSRPLAAWRRLSPDGKAGANLTHGKRKLRDFTVREISESQEETKWRQVPNSLYSRHIWLFKLLVVVCKCYFDNYPVKLIQGIPTNGGCWTFTIENSMGIHWLLYERNNYSLNTLLWRLLEASFPVFRSGSWDRIPTSPEPDWKKFSLWG